jgi:hypothetical protein
MGILKVPASGLVVLAVVVPAIVVLAIVVLAGCGGDGTGTGTGGKATGTVGGTITLSGGPAGASGVAAGGTVVAKKGGKQIGREQVGEGQQFSFALPAGRYTLAADTNELPCLDTTVTVSAGADQTVTLVCSIK